MGSTVTAFSAPGARAIYPNSGLPPAHSLAGQTNHRVLDLVATDIETTPTRTRGSPSLFGQLRWQTASNLGAAALGGIYLVYLGRKLGAREFGLFALVTGVASFAFSATDLRSQEAMVRYLAVFAEKPVERAACVRLLLFVDAASRVIVWLLLLAVSPLVAKFLIKSHDAFATIVVAATAAMLAKIGRAARELTDAQIAVRGAVAATAQSGAGEVGRFLTVSAAMSLSDSFVRELDTTVVAWYLPLPDVGAYRMAKNIVLMLWRAVDPVYVVLMPEFARQLAGGRRHDTVRLATRTTMLVFAGSIVVRFYMFFILPTAVSAILGVSFSAVPQTANLMALGLLLGAPLIWTHALSVGAGKVHVQLCANLLGAV